MECNSRVLKVNISIFGIFAFIMTGLYRRWSGREIGKGPQAPNSGHPNPTLCHKVVNGVAEAINPHYLNIFLNDCVQQQNSRWKTYITHHSSEKSPLIMPKEPPTSMKHCEWLKQVNLLCSQMNCIFEYIICIFYNKHKYIISINNTFTLYSNSLWYFWFVLLGIVVLSLIKADKYTILYFLSFSPNVSTYMLQIKVYNVEIHLLVFQKYVL